MQTSAQELEGSFLTMSKSNANDIMNQYMNQIQQINQQDARDSANMLSPIPETDSNHMTTIDSARQTMRSSDTVKRVTVNPDEERKLTGTGKYDIDAYEYDNDYYSDDFESDDEEEDATTSNGCSGSTLDTNAQRQAQANSASQAHELQRVLQGYNMILEGTTDEDIDFSQYRPQLDSSIGAQSASLTQSRQMTPLEHEANEMRSLSHSESRPITNAIKPMNERLEEQKAQIAAQMGQDVY